MTKHFLNGPTIECTNGPGRTNKQQVNISPHVDWHSIKSVNCSDHYHKPLAHSSSEQLAAYVIPAVHPVGFLVHSFADCPVKAGKATAKQIAGTVSAYP